MSKQLARVDDAIDGEFISSEEFDPGSDADPEQASGTQNGKPDSAATILVNMARTRYDFGISTTGETYAIPKEVYPVVALLRGSKTAIRSTLAREFFKEHRRAASQQALTDALSVIEGFAQEKDEQELYLRVAENDEGLWLDLGDMDFPRY